MSTTDIEPGRRQRPSRKSKESGAWITTYADAVTILLAFFVILYSMSEIDVMKFTAFLEGLRVPFGNESGEGLLPATDGLQSDHPPPSPITGFDYRDAPDRLDPDEVDAEDDQPEMPIEPDPALAGAMSPEDQLAQIAEALNEALEDDGLQDHVELRREERGLVVSIASDDILFALGSTEIDMIGRDIIDVVARTLDGYPNPLLVEGHTDDVPLDRNGYTNWNLSTDRAVEVLQLMIEDHGLPSDRVGAVGYGEYHPLESNDSATGRARNRRVDIVVLISVGQFGDRLAAAEDER